MYKFIPILLISSFFLVFNNLTPAQDCKVLIAELSDSYKGDCKNGLAHGKGKAEGVRTYEGEFKKGYPHGKGVYTYANGDIYTGELRKGLKNGEGELVYKTNPRDSILKGIWDDDMYIGIKLIRPQVIYISGIDSYSIRRERNGNRFLVDIKINGTPNLDIDDFTIIATSGTQFQLGRSFGYENVDFPVNCKIKYKSWNKIGASQHWSTFEFEIAQPGDWKIILVN